MAIGEYPSIETNPYEQKVAMKITPRFYEETASWWRPICSASFLSMTAARAQTPHCALCCSKITESYVREIGTKFRYCSRGCFLGHSKLGQLVIEHRARAAS